MELHSHEDGSSQLTLENRDEAFTLWEAVVTKLGADGSTSPAEAQQLLAIKKKVHKLLVPSQESTSFTFDAIESKLAIQSMVFLYSQRKFVDEREELMEHFDALGIKP